MGKSVIRLSLGFHLLALLSPQQFSIARSWQVAPSTWKICKWIRIIIHQGLPTYLKKRRKKRTLKIIKTKPIICFNKWNAPSFIIYPRHILKWIERQAPHESQQIESELGKFAYFFLDFSASLPLKCFRLAREPDKITSMQFKSGQEWPRNSVTNIGSRLQGIKYHKSVSKLNGKRSSGRGSFAGVCQPTVISVSMLEFYSSIGRSCWR